MKQISDKLQSRAKQDADLTLLPMAAWPPDVRDLEPVHGWIQRAAETNHAYSTTSFIENLGLNGRDWDFDALLEVTEPLPLQDFPALKRNTPKRIRTGYNVNNLRVPKRFIAKRGRRVCPVCLSESRHVRTWFDFVPVVNCPVHDVVLIEGLDDDLIDWRRCEVGVTKGGITISREHATHSVASHLDRFAIGALGVIEFTIPDHFENEEFSNVIYAAKCVGRLFRGDERGCSSAVDGRHLAQSGFTALYEGFDALADFLQGADWLNSGFEQRHFEKQVAHASVYLRAIGSTRLHKLINDAFGLARVRTGASTPSGRLGKFDGQGGAWSMKSAARQLRLTADHLRVILAQLALNPEKCPRTRTRRVTANQIEQVAAYIDGALSARQVRKLLGCEAPDVDELVHRKVLQTSFRLDGIRYFERKAVNAFIDQFAELSREGGSAPRVSLRTFASDANTSIANILGQIIRGRVECELIDRNGPIAEQLNVIATPDRGRSRETAAGRKQRLRPAAQIREHITFASAGARLGTGSAGLNELISMRLLRTTIGKHGRTAICETSLRNFERQFVKAAAYAPQLRCHPTSALKLLRKMGVKPVNDTGSQTVKFVSLEAVKQSVGLDLEASSDLKELRAIQRQIRSSLAANSIPATASIVADPAITVRASTGRWSFHVEIEDMCVTLKAHFRAGKEHGRLEKMACNGCKPEEIWPGASVHSVPNGGFISVDRRQIAKLESEEDHSLPDLCVRRSLELHRLL